jgi:hypothetical protein
MNAIPAVVAGWSASSWWCRRRRARSIRWFWSPRICRRQRNLPDRRRAGDCRARLRDRDDRAGGQDRRAGQRLCGGGQAAGLRHGRHRHDRRPVGSAGHGRRRQRSRLDRRDLLAQAEHDPVAQSILITDDGGFRRPGGRGRRHAVEDVAARRDGAASWRDFGAVIEVPEIGGDRLSRSPTGSRPNTWNWPARTRKAQAKKSAMPARSSSGAIRRR